MSHRDTEAAREAVRHYEEIHMKPRWPYREIISGGGGEGCEIIIRRTLWKRNGFKLLLHRFVPHSRDVDPHDHPSSFVTFVLWGSYTDESPCECQRETSMGSLAEVYRQNDLACPDCGGEGVVREKLGAGTLRFRPANHLHSTVTGRWGAWTLILMAPKRRAWGFVKDGEWMPWHEYVEKYGAAMSCE